MARSSKKGPYVDEKLQLKVSRGAEQPIKTWARNSQISPEMIGVSFSVHNGKNFILVKVTENMVGHRLGEFSPTRKFVRHGGKMQKEMEAKAVEGQKTATSATTSAKAPSVKK